MIQYDESSPNLALCLACLERIIGDGWHLENPSVLDVMQAQNKQNDAECSEDDEVQCERHNMLGVNCPMEDINTISQR